MTLGSNSATTLTTGNDNTSTTFAGIISGDGGLTKVGSGTLTLTGLNTCSGWTTFVDGIVAVPRGVLAEGSTGPLGSGPLTFNGGTLEDLEGKSLLEEVPIKLDERGGTFLVDSDSTLTLKGTISGPGSFTKAGPGTVTILGDI